MWPICMILTSMGLSESLMCHEISLISLSHHHHIKEIKNTDLVIMHEFLRILI